MAATFPGLQHEHRFPLYVHAFGYFKGNLLLNAHLESFGGFIFIRIKSSSFLRHQGLLRTQCCPSSSWGHCCGTGSIPGPGTSTCCGHGQNKVQPPIISSPWPRPFWDYPASRDNVKPLNLEISSSANKPSLTFQSSITVHVPLLIILILGRNGPTAARSLASGLDTCCHVGCPFSHAIPAPSPDVPQAFCFFTSP